MRKFFFAWLALGWLTVFFASAQNKPVRFTAKNTFRTAQNPHYWANRPPDYGYWQQDVHYEIKARIDDNTDIINGDSFKLTYWNNSPDTLSELFFHLYQNAFQPNSHYHDLWRGNNQKATFGEKYESKGLGTVCENIKVDGQTVDTTTDNTIMRLTLNKPLLPGEQNSCYHEL